MADADDVAFERVDPRARVSDFKVRVLTQFELTSRESVTSLQLVKCEPGAEPTPQEVAAAASLKTRATIAQSGLRTDNLLLLVFREASPPAVALPAALQFPPSALCDANVWKRVQATADSAAPPFACFRPPVLSPHALPAALLSPIFAKFLRTASSDVTAMQDCSAESRAVVRLVAQMPRVFESERSRGDVFRAILREELGIILEPTQPDPGSSACTDGSCMHRVADSVALLALEEDKLEVGSSGDPYFQGQAYYFRHWHAADRDGRAAAFAGDVRPALMLELIGPHLRVCALATGPGGRVLCEPLTPLLHLLALTGQPVYMSRLVTSLRALREALHELRMHYERVAASPPPTVAPALLPYPLRDAARFADVRLLQEGKLLFHASWSPPSGGGALRVCVKFVTRYRPDIHALWAGAGLAPALYACEPLGGDDAPWHMVIMELLHPQTWQSLPALQPDARAAARPVAQAALAAAHALRLPSGASCVHGDARDVNVMMSRTPDGGWRAAFVDFDWAGEEGRSTYPILMSVGLTWAPGARPGLPMLQANDTQQLSMAGGC